MRRSASWVFTLLHIGLNSLLPYVSARDEVANHFQATLKHEVKHSGRDVDDQEISTGRRTGRKKGKRSRGANPKVLNRFAELLLKPWKSFETLQMLSKGTVDIGALAAADMEYEGCGARSPCPVVLVALKEMYRRHHERELFNITIALLEAGASPDASDGDVSMLSLAIGLMGVHDEAFTLWDLLIERQVSATARRRLGDIVPFYLPFSAVFARVLRTHDAISKLLLALPVVLLQNRSVDEYVTQSSAIDSFSIFRRCPSFSKMILRLKREADTGSDGTAKVYSAELIRAYDEAIAGILRDLIRMPGFSIADAMSSDDIGGNILHKLAYYGMGGTIQVFAAEATGAADATAVLSALRQPDQQGRTPLHFASYVFGWERETVLSQGRRGDAQVHVYADCISSARTLHRALGQEAVTQEEIEASLPQVPNLLVGARNRPDAAVSSAAHCLATTGNSGGWPLSSFGVRELETFPVGKCEIQIVEAAPKEGVASIDAAALQEMLRPHLTTRRPVLIRGAALSMQTRWTMSAMLRKYGDELFNVSLIPYAETFGKRSLPPEHRLVRDLPNFTQSGRLSVR